MTSLIDLHSELDRRGIPLIVGGGFGLYLKRMHLLGTGERTLFKALPAARATNDIDLFLRAEVLADAARAAAVAESIRALDYRAIPTAAYYQWVRTMAVSDPPHEVKLDVLVGPTASVRSRLHGDGRRLRPKGKSIGLHAHPTEEAIGIEDDPVPIPISGQKSDGTDHRGTVYVPRAFPYLMMKLHAFDDRKDDLAKELGRHHALDAYTVVGMMTEAEYEGAMRNGADLGPTEHVARARQIVDHSFSGPTSTGLLRLREHPLYRADFALPEFIDVLKDIFTPSPGAG